MDFNVRRTREKINILTEEPLARYTYLKTGGPAQYLAFPRTYQEVSYLLHEAHISHTPVTILGGTTNTLISDEGIKGLVISTRYLKGISIMGSLVVAAAGESLDNVINKAIEHHLVGLEKLGGIPGSIGGAVKGGVGAHGLSIDTHYFYADYIDKDNFLRRMPHFSDAFSYRKSPFEEEDVILTVALRLQPNHNTAKAKLEKEHYAKERVQKGQFNYPSLGCFFKNPEGQSAGALIDACQLKGLRIGDARVSLDHANFLINVGHATSQEFYRLGLKVQEIVAKKMGVQLSFEVQFKGPF